MSQMYEQHEKCLNVYHFRWFDLFAGIPPKSYQYVVKVMKMFFGTHRTSKTSRGLSHICYVQQHD